MKTNHDFDDKKLAAEIRDKRVIVIAGRPQVGKTTLAKSLAMHLGRPVLHTDDYIHQFSFKDAAANLIEIAKGFPWSHEPLGFIVEGVQALRMLRTGEREGTWKPDLVIYCDASIFIDKKHVSLAALTKSAYTDWMAMAPGVDVIFSARY